MSPRCAEQSQQALLAGVFSQRQIFILLDSQLSTFLGAEDDPKEWPGPKAWPATLALISFFAVNVFGQVCLISSAIHQLQWRKGLAQWRMGW